MIGNLSLTFFTREYVRAVHDHRGIVAVQCSAICPEVDNLLRISGCRVGLYSTAVQVDGGVRSAGIDDDG